jgi:hypothetical protein
MYTYNLEHSQNYWNQPAGFDSNRRDSYEQEGYKYEPDEEGEDHKGNEGKYYTQFPLCFLSLLIT